MLGKFEIVQRAGPKKIKKAKQTSKETKNPHKINQGSVYQISRRHIIFLGSIVISCID